MRVKITEAQASALSRAARGTKNTIWADIRRTNAAFIPAGSKLGVEVDPNRANYLDLYVKGSYPRQYLSRPDETAAPACGSGRFCMAQDMQEDVRWRYITRMSLLAFLRGEVDEDCTVDEFTDEAVGTISQLPAGFPTNTTRDSLILDQRTGNLYFQD